MCWAELLVGVLLGNLGLIGIDILEPISADVALRFLAEFGVVLLLFQTGLESSLDRMRAVGGSAAAVAVTGVVAPMALAANYLDVEIDRAAAARFGLNVMDVQDALMGALGGTLATQTIEGRERYGVLVRYPRDFRQSVAAVGNLRIPVMGGTSQVPLGQVATVLLAQGPMAVKTENAFPLSAVYVDVERRDIGGYVRDARRVLEERLTLVYLDSALNQRSTRTR